MTKFVHHTWRPRRAIRELVDPTWSPRAGTAGSSPEYTSGHSSFSTAGATVLAGFFCDDEIPFALHTDPTSGIETGTRSYGSFSEAAAEAGLSRVLGGLHFPFSNEDGTEAGLGVASEVLATALLREHGPTHTGGCPR
jgi:membrane-associated phospholipid phosphatase